MKVLVASALFVMGVLFLCDPTRASSLNRVRRQEWNWGDESPDNRPPRPPRPVRPTGRPTFRPPSRTPPPPTPTSTESVDGETTTTTASPQFRACVAACQTTPQYNPVCATNRVTYSNVGQMNCARSCGLEIDTLFFGTCSPL